jgi:FAD/FMN-containing dehydrogenase
MGCTRRRAGLPRSDSQVSPTDDDEANERWHHETLKSLEPITRGHYMRETDLLASPTRAAESLAPGIWQRLQTIRQRYDPDGVFYGHIGQA